MLNRSRYCDGANSVSASQSSVRPLVTAVVLHDEHLDSLASESNIALLIHILHSLFHTTYDQVCCWPIDQKRNALSPNRSVFAIRRSVQTVSIRGRHYLRCFFTIQSLRNLGSNVYMPYDMFITPSLPDLSAIPQYADHEQCPRRFPRDPESSLSAYSRRLAVLREVLPPEATRAIHLHSSRRRCKMVAGLSQGSPPYRRFVLTCDESGASRRVTRHTQWQRLRRLQLRRRR